MAANNKKSKQAPEQETAKVPAEIVEKTEQTGEETAKVTAPAKGKLTEDELRKKLKTEEEERLRSTLLGKKTPFDITEAYKATRTNIMFSLKNTDESVGRIALRVGIGSENYFFSLFKPHF